MSVGTACGSHFSGPIMPALLWYLLGACGEREAGLNWALAQHKPRRFCLQGTGRRQILPSDRNLFGQRAVFLL